MGDHSDIDHSGLPGVGGGTGYDEGTSFPGGPSTDDKFYRTDLNYLCYYDGTRWLTTTEHRLSTVGSDVTGTTAATPTLGYVTLPNSYDIYLTTIDVTSFIATTNSGTNYWTITANKVAADNSNTSLGNFNTSADSASTWTPHSIAVNAVVARSGFKVCRLNTAKTLSPGAIHWAASFNYRLVVT